MRRFDFEYGPIKVLVDIPEEIFEELNRVAPKKLKQSVAALGKKAIDKAVEAKETNTWKPFQKQ